MTTRSGIPVNVIIADTGPLVSLAACGRLDLLGAFRRPVKIPDVVKAECLRYPDKIGAATLEEWFSLADVPVETIANFRVIPSAETVIEEIADGGRKLARYLADRPGRLSPGTKTTWAEVLDASEASGGADTHTA